LPSYLVHCKVSKALFGKSYWRIHKAIDSAYPIWGRYHRRYFHDNVSAMGFAQSLYPGDEKALQAAKFHLQLDELCSENPAFRKWLESWAKKKVKKRRSGKKVKAKELLPSGVEQLFTNIDKMADVLRLKKMIEGR
jgi:hypothetical protein